MKFISILILLFGICLIGFKYFVGMHDQRIQIDFEDTDKNIRLELQQFMESCIPEIEGNIRFVECSTPLTIRDFANNPFGSVYGVKHKVGQYNPLPLTKSKGL